MDYTELARELMANMYEFRRSKTPHKIDESVRGGGFILMFLFQRGSYALPSELRGVLGVSSARIAATLNNMEHKGLISREMDKNDRRKVLVALTPTGQEQAAQMERRALEHSVHMLEFLGERDAKEFVRILGKFSIKE